MSLRKIFLCFLVLIISAPCENVVLNADTVTYQESLSQVKASGDVFVAYGVRTLKSKTLIYDIAEKKINAFGNVILKNEDGHILTTSRVSFVEDLSQGDIDSFKLLLSDQSTFCAHKGKRLNKNHLILNQASFTSCYRCKIPLWKVRAKTIEHKDKMITYRGAILDIKGVPVFCMPYFTHPDPSVKQKRGLLPPSLGMNKDLGLISQTPVYFPIAPNKDMTLTPLWTTRQNPAIIGEYRQRFSTGKGKISASYTKTNHLNESITTPISRPIPSKRYHVSGFLNHQISDPYHLQLDINRASDTSYLSRYPIRVQAPAFAFNRNLTSQGMLERVYPSSYASIHSYVFQTDTPKITPLILPKASFEKTHSLAKGTLVSSFDFLSLQRRDFDTVHQKGVERLSSSIEWTRVHIISGHKLTPKVLMRGDGYFIHTGTSNHSLVRIFPQGSLEWGYPLYSSKSSFLVEPKAMIVAASSDHLKSRIPNEDCWHFGFDDTNIFTPNRFYGLDRVDEGRRMIYGVDNTWFKFKRVNVFLGQDVRLDKRNVFQTQPGESARRSDLIGLSTLQLSSDLNFRHRFAVNPRFSRFRYSETGATFGPQIIHADIAHVFGTREEMHQPQAVSQLSAQIKSHFHAFWKTSVATIFNLRGEQKSLANFFNIHYQDECFQAILGVYRNFQRTKDIRPDTGFLIQFIFKHLGTLTPSNTVSYPGSLLTVF